MEVLNKIPSLVVKDGGKSFVAATAPTVVAAGSTVAPFAIIEGSATKVLRIKKIIVSGATTADIEYNTIVLTKYSTASTGGTATALTKVPMDSISPASTANLCSVFTAAPTAGTAVGTVGVKRITLQDTTINDTAADGLNTVEFDFSDRGGIVLRGVAQGLGIRFGANAAAAATLCVSIEWSEEA